MEINKKWEIRKKGESAGPAAAEVFRALKSEAPPGRQRTPRPAAPHLPPHLAAAVVIPPPGCRRGCGAR
jgi:hypothetical protein